ncbi:pilus assembly protein PilM [Pelagicoccus sp. SDUM812005]|uniref:pilus assembly protein PilM n=1 Tax=Pelagicoccus sp. SDUM812005 TaxID=3041257 RepID=UPI00281019B3|nr:pilus assembly protein PilM [Pelagicoccus sp. SDUM812005]MDQ8180038.1 pilus assembly protein PilM [Pelagicoccus sp. SDUM812005]
MSNPHFLAISLGANYLCSVHLKMNPSGRCELLDYQIDSVDFSSNDPLLWLKATSAHLDAVALRFRSQMPAGFSIPGHVALCKYLKIPQVSRGKRPKIVAFEAKQNIPYPIEEVTWEFAVIEEDGLDFDAVIGASRTEIVETIARYSKDSEIDLRGIEPSTTSLVNVFRYNYADVKDAALVVSIGAKSTDLVFVDGTRYHSRNIPFGGQSISAEISESLGVAVSEAERIKLSATKQEALASEEYAAYENAKRNFEARLGTEVLRTSAVLKRQGFDFEAKAVYLTGGGSLLPQLDSALSDKLKLPVQALDPVRNVNVSKDSLLEEIKSAAPFLADAIGIGVGRFMPDGATLDLTPRSLVWHRKFRRQQPFYLLAGLVACGAVGLPILNTSLEIRAYEQELQNLDVQVRPLSQINKEIFNRTEQIKRIRDVIEKTASVTAARSTWLDVLNDLQRRLADVEDVWLDELRLERPVPKASSGRGVARVKQDDGKTRVHLSGRLIDVYNPVSSVSPASYERVKTLLESLNEANFVANLENEQFDYSVPGFLGFKFTLVVKEEVPL